MKVIQTGMANAWAAVFLAVRLYSRAARQW